MGDVIVRKNMFMKYDMSAYVKSPRKRIQSSISLIMGGITYKDTPYRARLKFVLSVRSEINIVIQIHAENYGQVVWKTIYKKEKRPEE